MDAQTKTDSAALAQFAEIAAELVTQFRKSVTIDWTVRESARAKISKCWRNEIGNRA